MKKNLEKRMKIRFNPKPNCTEEEKKKIYQKMENIYQREQRWNYDWK